jgi:hypothetical protein
MMSFQFDGIDPVLNLWQYLGQDYWSKMSRRELKERQAISILERELDSSRNTSVLYDLVQRRLQDPQSIEQHS